MRIYIIDIPAGPDREAQRLRLTNIRKLSGLPEGTTIEVDCDYDSYPLPVKDGKPDFKHGRAKHRARLIRGLV